VVASEDEFHPAGTADISIAYVGWSGADARTRKNLSTWHDKKLPEIDLFKHASF
jgi:hypothetical protein